MAAARHRPDAELSTWWGERYCKERYCKERYCKERYCKERYCKERFASIVYPDGVGVWREGGATVVFCLEYDRGTEQLARLVDKAADYARLEEGSGWAFWLLAVVTGPRRERGARVALSGQGLAVATTTQPQAGRPTDAIWAPLGADGTRVRLADLAGWPRPPESVARLVRAASYREQQPTEEAS